MRLLLLTLVLLLAAVILLGVKVLFIKGAKFPSGHVGANPALLRRGMRCASSQPSQGKSRHGTSKP